MGVQTSNMGDMGTHGSLGHGTWRHGGAEHGTHRCMGNMERGDMGTWNPGTAWLQALLKGTWNWRGSSRSLGDRHGGTWEHVSMGKGLRPGDTGA
jgi:hypothetical protein